MGCFGSYHEAFDNVYIMNNVTKVKNYQIAGGFVDPYAVAEQQLAPDCSEYNNGGCPDNPCYVCGDFGVTSYNLPCWQLDPSNYQDCGPGTSSFTIDQYHNCFAHSPVTFSISKCHPLVGWKAVAASKQWPGRLPYTSRKWLFPDDFGSWCCSTEGCFWHNEDKTADQTKYLRMSSNSSTTLVTSLYDCTTTTVGTICCPDGSGGTICGDDTCTSCTLTGTTTCNASANSTVHMDKFGNDYIDVCSSGSSGCDEFNLAPAAHYAWIRVGDSNSNVIDNYTRYCAAIQSYGTPSTIIGSGNSWHLEWTSSYTCFDDCGNPTTTTAYTTVKSIITPTTYDIYTYAPVFPKDHCGHDGSCYSGVIQTSHLHWEYSATGFAYSGDYQGFGSISVDQTFHEEVNGSLSSPYTMKQVEDDLNQNLLAQWDIGLDYIYPWRYTDSNVTQLPYVHYDETGGSPNVGTCDTSSVRYTGQIRGKPIYEKVGDKIYVPDKFWNPYHKNFCICDSLVQPGCLTMYIHTHGAYSSDIGVPCASEWLNYSDADQLPQGAFKATNFRSSMPNTCNSSGDNVAFDDMLWAVKYAEIVIPKQSYNYARPCGKDRFMPTGSGAVHCITASVDHTLTLDSFGGTTDIVSGDYVWVCGTSDKDGCWKANSDGAYTITLIEPRIVSASALVEPPIINCGTANGIVAKLRWQVLQPAICGRIDIAQVHQPFTGSIVTCSLAEPSYLVNNDEIQIAGSKGFKDINKVWKVKVIDPHNVGLIGSETLPVKTYLGSGQMYSTFAPDWKWDDVSSKGQYSTLQYNYNFRDIGEYTRLASDWTASQYAFLCDGVTPCVPGTVPSFPRAEQASYGFDNSISKLDCDTQCLISMDCAPAVAYFSPNSESFVNGNNHGFPYIGGDTQYGVRWNGVVKQTMVDPLFQVPPCPCAPETMPGEDDDGFPVDIPDGKVNCTQFRWEMDTGLCVNDYTDGNQLKHKLYPLAGQYEAMCEIPDGAPPLPPGVHIGCLKPTDYKAGKPCPGGNICFPPHFGPQAAFFLGATCSPYVVFPYATPWLTFLYSYNCVCNEGRFAQAYEDNGITCENIILPPPF